MLIYGCLRKFFFRKNLYDPQWWALCLHRNKVTFECYEKHLIPLYPPLAKGGGLPARSRFGEGRGGILKELLCFNS
ncbi:MAG: hypothetical protein A2156_07180 [Deltaproteobacteria bacterium RBG_16_48_10]|nr:MAG: hypothetical protein A2156_07180 [Deltaproteobacteria bacterium RBG_16_48_10]